MVDNDSNYDIERYKLQADMLKAIAHPIRILIISILKHERLTVSEIHEILNIEQATASHHLRILRDRHILEAVRNGRNTYYYLKNSNLTKIIDCIEDCCPTVS